MVKTAIRKALSGKGDDYSFYRYRGNSFRFSPTGGLYIHIPFCKTLCPYCPYFKVPYEPELAKRFVDALKREIRYYGKLLGRKKFTSLYVGGGTPTVLLPELLDIRNELERFFTIEGPVALETNPDDIDGDTVSKLQELGCTMVSVGVQSFNDDLLAKIGRRYTGLEAERSLALLLAGGFSTVNVDLMFVLPGQGMWELEDSLRKSIQIGAQQVTTYPLFTFPYSKVGSYRRLRKLKMPGYTRRKKMYYFIEDFLLSMGYQKRTVWAFIKGENPLYSSVTRDYYLGLGPSAASYTGQSFSFNTFSLPEYLANPTDRLPICMQMKVSKTMEELFWFYWRLYETKISRTQFREQFAGELYERFGWLLHLGKLLGWVKERGDLIELTKGGCHHIHLAQNHFALNYVNKIWKESQTATLPEKISL